MKKKKPLTLSEKIRKIKKAGLQVRFALNTPDLEQVENIRERVNIIIRLIKKGSEKKPGEMIFFVFYDISDNKVRRAIAAYLLKKGCQRIQRSVFMGCMGLKKYNTVYHDLKEVQSFYENEDSIIIMPISELELQKMKLIGQNIDVDLTLGKDNSMFF